MPRRQATSLPRSAHQPRTTSPSAAARSIAVRTASRSTSTPNTRHPILASATACRPRPIATSSARRGARRLVKQRVRGLHHERRWWIGGESIGHTLLIVAQALLSALFLGLLGLVVAAFLGLRGGEISRHITFGFFSAMLTMLAHSMMMFYLIGKGKAVKDAMAEYHLDRRLLRAHRRGAQAGVLDRDSWRWLVTIVAAILGASVDTGVLPPIVHAMIAYGAIAANVAAVEDRDRRTDRLGPRRRRSQSADRFVT